MVEIRVLGPSDREILNRVEADVFDRPIDSALAGEFVNDPRHHLAVAIDGEIVVGMASAVHYVHPDKPAQIWINEIGISPAYRRQGIARRLLSALFDVGRRHGCAEAWVATEPDNAAARGLYAEAGGREDPAVVYTFDL